MKKSLILTLTALLLFGAFAVFRLWPEKEDSHDHGDIYLLRDGEVIKPDDEHDEEFDFWEADDLPSFWHGELGDRPALTEITLTLPSSQTITIIRNDLDDEAPLGLSRYQLVSPISFMCNDDRVRTMLINTISSIDFDDVAADVEFAEELSLELKAEGFERTLFIGEKTPNGGRYIKLKGDDTVYIDLLGDYSFLDITPLDLTYGLAFWLYKFDDVENIIVTDDGRERHVPGDTSDINMRRFFSHILNFSIAANALESADDFRRKITLEMTDGSTRELRFARQNERQLAVSVDGATPVFACNIKDWQKIIEDLDALDSGKGIREE
ncbi:MAG: DUF4340 domain-containing protein [Oscillospiraceae bacterium]|nr:DUF4340 domain-containing protein [Oscillospiraceae bacterium]